MSGAKSLLTTVGNDEMFYGCVAVYYQWEPATQQQVSSDP